MNTQEQINYLLKQDKERRINQEFRTFFINLFCFLLQTTVFVFNFPQNVGLSIWTGIFAILALLTMISCVYDIDKIMKEGE